jgi:hypothetical protein
MVNNIVWPSIDSFYRVIQPVKVIPQVALPVGHPGHNGLKPGDMCKVVDNKRKLSGSRKGYTCVQVLSGVLKDWLVWFCTKKDLSKFEIKS